MKNGENKLSAKGTEEYIRSKIESIINNLDLSDILRLNWLKEAYKRTKLIEGNPLLEAESDSGFLVPQKIEKWEKTVPNYLEKSILI